MNYAERTFVRLVGGKEIPVTVSTAELEIDPTDLVREASKVAARMGLVSSLLAERREVADLADADYRRWLGQATGALGEKIAVEKAKKAVEAQRDFVKHKAAIAEAESDALWLDKFWEALRTKARMIETLSRMDGANERAATHTGREPLPQRKL